MHTLKTNEKPVVKIKFSIGFGNNLFQYIYSRLLAEHHKAELSHPFLPGFKFEAKNFKLNSKFRTIHVKKKEYATGAYKKYFMNTREKCNYNLVGYFEDYTLYSEHLEKIKNWFPKIEKNNKNDLILHLRLQNRLVEVNHFLNLIEPKKYISVIRMFKFKKLHIVTDLEKWEEYYEKDILKIKKDLLAGPNPGTTSVAIEDSLLYVNSLIKELSKLNPIVHCSNAQTIFGSGGLRGNFMDAFNFIRSFDQVIMYNSTFSWWAAVLGGASKVAVFSLWKPDRETNCPNLGNTNFPGWFSYGNKSDLISNRPEFKKYKTLSWKQRYLRSTILKRIIQVFRLITFAKKYNSKRDYN